VGRFHLGGFSVGVGAGPGIGNAPGTAGVRAMLSVGYAGLGAPVVEEKPPDDADVDGIPDDYDECPKQAGPEDRNGCPAEQDIDGDGIIEGDACPDDPGARYEDPEANGCPDRDNDRIPDPVDPCPIEPGPRAEGCPKYARLRGVDSPGKIRFRIDPPIKFNKRSAKLSKKAIETLQEIVATMRANPKLEQISITVGAKRARQKLTDERAKAILLILSEDQDFDSNRYEVVIGEDLVSGAVKFRVIQ
jgi:outer membrane protein OmpA-like peptidoglycan-associated protein